MGSGVGCGGARQRCRQVHKGGAWHNNIRPGDLTKHASSAGGSAHNTVDLPSVLPSPRWCKASHRRRTAHDRTPHFHLTTTHDVERNNDNKHTNHTTTKKTNFTQTHTESWHWSTITGAPSAHGGHHQHDLPWHHPQWMQPKSHCWPATGSAQTGHSPTGLV